MSVCPLSKSKRLAARPILILKVIPSHFLDAARVVSAHPTKTSITKNILVFFLSLRSVFYLFHIFIDDAFDLCDGLPIIAVMDTMYIEQTCSVNIDNFVVQKYRLIALDV